jgi:hypothetical protein
MEGQSPLTAPPGTLTYMEDNPGSILIRHITPDNIRNIERDLSVLIESGYGEIIIRVDRHHVTGHQLIIKRNYAIYKKDPSQ